MGKYDIRDYGDFTQADEALKKKQTAESAVNNIGNFGYDKKDTIDTALNNIVNAKPFEYDFNTDAMYQQFKDMYAAMGQQAMQDTIGQASAMTGGYANSYAATAGNQAYQGYLQQASQMLPQFYAMALQRYNAEQDHNQNVLNALNADYSRKYGEWNDTYNRMLANRDYYSNASDKALNIALQMAQGNYGMEQDAINNEWRQKEFDRGVYEYDTNLAYQKERDAVSDSQWQKSFDETQRANKASENLSWANYNLDKTSKDQSAKLAAAESEARVANARLGILTREDFEKSATKNLFSPDGSGYTYNGVDYASYDDYVVEMAEKAKDVFNLTGTEIANLYAVMGL